MRERVEYHVFADNVLTEVYIGFVEAGTVARTMALREPGVLVTVARMTGATSAIRVARFQVVEGVLDAWVS